MNPDQEKLETWAIVELSGHLTLAGYLKEREISGHGFIQLDIPKTGPANPAVTMFIGPSFVYRITPVDEVGGRQAALKLAANRSVLSTLRLDMGREY